MLKNTFTYRPSQSTENKFQTIVYSKLRLVSDLSEYIQKCGVFYADPRKYLFSDENTSSSVVPIHNFENMPIDDNFFANTFVILEKILGDSLERIFICKLAPGSDYKSYSESTTTIRCYIPLVSGFPFYMSGVWTKSRKVQHFSSCLYISHAMQEPHNIFNYSNSEAIFLVVDVK